MHCKSLWIKASAKCINVNIEAQTEQMYACIQHVLTPNSSHIDHFFLLSQDVLVLLFDNQGTVFDAQGFPLSVTFLSAGPPYFSVVCLHLMICMHL